MSCFEGQLASWVAPAHPMTVSTTQTIAALVAEYSTALYRVAFSVTRNAAEAEDAVQETFLRVLRHESRLGEIRDYRVWLVRIVWNIVLDKKRRAKTRPEGEDIADHARALPSGDRAADATAISSQEHARILALIDRLPDREREALLAFRRRRADHCRNCRRTRHDGIFHPLAHLSRPQESWLFCSRKKGFRDDRRQIDQTRMARSRASPPPSTRRSRSVGSATPASASKAASSPASLPSA